MSNNCTVKLSNEQYVLLTECLKLAKVQQRMRLSELYRGEVPCPGGEKFIYRMEEKIEKIRELRDYLIEEVEWITEEEKDCVDISLRFDSKVLWVSPTVYERVKNNPDEIIIESQCQPPIILKTVGVGK